MLEHEPELDTGRHWRLTSLLEDVKAARRVLDLARHDKRHVEQQQLRKELLAALDAYAAALDLGGGATATATPVRDRPLPRAGRSRVSHPA